ncbi:hypothetical protein PL222_04790 [Salmonella enterica]|uniref:hypothetical protein n=1 Tax=Salmonella enterica TaxID=28901 RepID=UPI0026DB04B3|nr:hypothetical protein [Salmonella enterica]MDO3814996.1 hypothetical protein [Salmonella enterica]MDO3824050.1 hypothetical protein [Salmonella enterica]
MATTPTPSQPTKVIRPYVRPVPEEIETRLDPFILALHRERCEMLCRFKLALEAAGVEFMEADHD